MRKHVKLTIMFEALLAYHREAVRRTIANQVVDHLIHDRLLSVVDDRIRSPLVAVDGRDRARCD